MEEEKVGEDIEKSSGDFSKNKIALNSRQVEFAK